MFLFLDVSTLKLRIITDRPTRNNSLDCPYNKKLSCLRLMGHYDFSHTDIQPKSDDPVCIHLLKGNNRNTRTRCEMYSKLTIKTPERRLASKNWLQGFKSLQMTLGIQDVNWMNIKRNGRLHNVLCMFSLLSVTGERVLSEFLCAN